MLDRQMSAEVTLLLGSVGTVRTRKLWILATLKPKVSSNCRMAFVALPTAQAAKLDTSVWFIPSLKPSFVNYI